MTLARGTRSSFPPVGPIERICDASGVHPVDVMALIESYLDTQSFREMAVLVEESKLTLLVEVLRTLGFCWYSEGVVKRESRQLGAEEIVEALGQVLDLPELTQGLQISLLEWIRHELEPWHSKLLLNAPILQRRGHDGLFQASCEW
jgi:hypothetical protein